MKVVFDDESSIKQKKDVKSKIPGKYIILICLGVILVTGMILLFCLPKSNMQNGYSSKEELVAAVISATYDDDFITVMNAMPKQFREKLEEKAVAYYGASEGKLESIANSYSGKFEEYAANLDAFYGESDTEEMWSESYEITDYYKYSDEETDIVRQMLNMAGIDRDYAIEEYGVITVKITINPTYDHKEIQEHDIFLPVLCHKGMWFLAQNYGTYAEEKMYSSMTDIYGSLLDGFVIDGTIDQYGYKILDTENGTTVRWDPKYESYTYTDMYGNIHLCTDKLKDTKVIGPDGGDPITEEEYNEQMKEYYENLDNSDAHVHTDTENVSDESVE